MYDFKFQVDSSQHLEVKPLFGGTSYIQSGLAGVIMMMIMTESYGRTSLIKTRNCRNIRYMGEIGNNAYRSNEWRFNDLNNGRHKSKS